MSDRTLMPAIKKGRRRVARIQRELLLDAKRAKHRAARMEAELSRELQFLDWLEETGGRLRWPQSEDPPRPGSVAWILVDLLEKAGRPMSAVELHAVAKAQGIKCSSKRVVATLLGQARPPLERVSRGVYRYVGPPSAEKGD